MSDGVRETTAWIAESLRKAASIWDEDVEVFHVDRNHIRLKELDTDEECVAEYTITVRRRNRAEGVQQEDD